MHSSLFQFEADKKCLAVQNLLLVAHKTGHGIWCSSGDRQYQGESTLDIDAQALANGMCMLDLRQQALVVHHHCAYRNCFLMQGWQAAVQEYQSLAEECVFDDHILAASKQTVRSSEVVQCTPFPFPHACHIQVSAALDEPQDSEDDPC